MKPKRTILLFDEEWNLPSLRLVLQMRGYKVISCTTEAQRETLMNISAVDLVLIGSRIETAYDGEVPALRRQPDWSVAELVERIRIGLIRKRGPKSVPVKACQQEQLRKAAAR